MMANIGEHGKSQSKEMANNINLINRRAIASRSSQKRIFKAVANLQRNFLILQKEILGLKANK